MAETKTEFDSVNQALEAYTSYFGEHYFFYVGFTKTDAESIREIQNCIKNGKRQSSPRYQDDLIY
ncbi:MAG: hypothetical protein Q4C58_10370 [Eubacteriales bacterium]|nr:hypothetical protein [Eubacteriales bacterium]